MASPHSSAIPPELREQIKRYLSNFMDALIHAIDSGEVAGSGNGLSADDSVVMPFHQAIIPVTIRKVSRFERSFSTRLGSTFEECARLIATQHHAEAHRSYRLEGRVSQAAVDEVNAQVQTFETMATSEQRISLDEMIEAILTKQTEPPYTELRVVTDLYVRQHDGTELFFEIKSPRPNKGQCLEVTCYAFIYYEANGVPMFRHISRCLTIPSAIPVQIIAGAMR